MTKHDRMTGETELNVELEDGRSLDVKVTYTAYKGHPKARAGGPYEGPHADFRIYCAECGIFIQASNFTTETLKKVEEACLKDATEKEEAARDAEANEL